MKLNFNSPGTLFLILSFLFLIPSSSPYSTDPEECIAALNDAITNFRQFRYLLYAVDIGKFLNVYGDYETCTTTIEG